MQNNPCESECEGEFLQHNAVPAVLVGLGKRGQKLVEALNLNKGLVDILCTVDPALTAHNIKESTQPDRITKLPNAHSIEGAYTQSPFSIGFILTPHDSHARLINEFLTRGTAVCVDKPLAISSAQAAEVTQRAIELDLPVITLLPYRYISSLDHLRVLPYSDLSECRIRVNAVVSPYDGVDGWRGEKKRSGGGVLFDLGYHFFDLFGDIFGRPNSAEAVLGFSAGEETEHSAEVTLTYGNFQVDLFLARSLELAPVIEIRLEEPSQIRRGIVRPKYPTTEWPSAQSLIVAQLIEAMRGGFPTSLTQQVIIDMNKQIATLQLVEHIYRTAQICSHVELIRRTSLGNIPNVH